MVRLCSVFGPTWCALRDYRVRLGPFDLEICGGSRLGTGFYIDGDEMAAGVGLGVFGSLMPRANTGPYVQFIKMQDAGLIAKRSRFRFKYPHDLIS